MQCPNNNARLGTNDGNGYRNEVLGRSSLEELSLEVLDMIMLHLEPTDLVALADSSYYFETMVASSRLWRQRTLQLSDADAYQLFRQLSLAPVVDQVQIGFATMDPKFANAAAIYNGPVPSIRKLSLKVSSLSDELGKGLLKKFGQRSRHIHLDLRHGPCEPPRSNIDLLQLLPTLGCVESVAVQLDSISDLIVLNKLLIKLVDIDISHLSVDVHDVGTGISASVAASELIYKHSSYIHTLHLPFSFHFDLCSAAMSCKELHTLACNLWSVPCLDHLSKLHNLIIFPPTGHVSLSCFQDLLSHIFHHSRKLLAKLKQLRFLNSYAECNLHSSGTSRSYALAIVRALIIQCRNLEVLEMQWNTENANPHRRYFIKFLMRNPNLRELRLAEGHLPLQFLYFVIAKCCSRLEILNVRRCKALKASPGFWKKRRQTDLYVKNYALDFLRQALPKVTVRIN